MARAVGSDRGRERHSVGGLMGTNTQHMRTSWTQGGRDCGVRLTLHRFALSDSPDAQDLPRKGDCVCMSAKLPTLIPLQEACAIAHCSRAAFYRASKKGILPRPITISGHALVNK